MRAHVQVARAVFFDRPDRNRVAIIRARHKGKTGKAPEAINFQIDRHDFRLGKIFIHQHELVASLAFVLVLVVGGRRNASRQKDPFLHGRRPENGLHDDVAGRFGAQRLADHLVLVLPVLAAQFAARVEDTDPEIVGVHDGPVGRRVLLAHLSHVEFAVLDGGPLPLHALVGVAFAFGDDKAGDDGRVGAVGVVENFKHVARAVVKGQQPVIVNGEFAEFRPAAGFVVVRHEFARWFERNVVLVPVRLSMPGKKTD